MNIYHFIFYFIYQPFETSSNENADEKYLLQRQAKGKVWGRFFVFFTLSVQLLLIKYFATDYLIHHTQTFSQNIHHSKNYYKNQNVLIVLALYVAINIYFNKNRLDKIIEKYDNIDFYTNINIVKFLFLVVLPPIILAVFLAN